MGLNKLCCFVGLSIFLEINYIEWALAILCVFSVLAAEGMNTAIEILANRISKERDNEIKKSTGLQKACTSICS